MFVERLFLKNFRNYSECLVTFNPKMNFIFGNNGNGKTNLLEAISILCFTKSMNKSPNTECVRYGSEYFNISATFNKSKISAETVTYKYENGSGKKHCSVNNNPIEKFSDIYGNFPVVVLTPYEMNMISGPQTERRRNFDMLISQSSKIYLNDIKSLNRILRQKNTVLGENVYKKKYSKKDLLSLLEIWNNAIVETGARVILKRLSFVSEFQKYISDTFTKLLGEENIPYITYESEFIMKGEDTVTIEHLKNRINDNIKNKTDEEIRRGMSLTGPQRDNYVFRMMKNNELFDVKTFASFGEQKTFLIALKFSEYEYLRMHIDLGTLGGPVLLLDDLFSELDSNRANKISVYMSELNQVFLTTTSYDYTNILGKYYKPEDLEVYEVINGSVSIH